MPRKHLTWEIDAYLNNRLSPADWQDVHAHLNACSLCARELVEAQQLNYTLRQTFQSQLGSPAVPPHVRQRTRHALYEQQKGKAFRLGPIFGGLATGAVMVLLALGVFSLVQGRPGPQNPLPTAEIAVLPANTPTPAQLALAPPTETATSQPPASPTSTQEAVTVDIPAATATPVAAQTEPGPEIIVVEQTVPPPTETPAQQATETATITPLPPAPATATPDTSIGIATNLNLPGGQIAFSFYNPAPKREVYEIHLLNPATGEHSRWPVDGVSEPALRHSDSGPELAFRSWGKPNNPRSLVSSALDETEQKQIGGFWEDAQPDWSPVEDRLIYASRRESDRRWRLYSNLADGSEEIPLLLEGHSPSFAPDGDRFVYVACDDSANNCGLWQTTLSDLNPEPLLLNPAAAAPDWSPNGDWIVYMAQIDGNWDLYLTDNNGVTQQRLTDDPAIEGLPVWSPDGEWLAYLSDKGGNWGIWVLQIESGASQQLFSFDGGTFTPPHEDPYGERNWWDEQLSWGE